MSFSVIVFSELSKNTFVKYIIKTIIKNITIIINLGSRVSKNQDKINQNNDQSHPHKFFLAKIELYWLWLALFKTYEIKVTSWSSFVNQ